MSTCMRECIHPIHSNTQHSRMSTQQRSRIFTTPPLNCLGVTHSVNAVHVMQQQRSLHPHLRALQGTWLVNQLVNRRSIKLPQLRITNTLNCPHQHACVSAVCFIQVHTIPAAGTCLSPALHGSSISPYLQTTVTDIAT